MKEQTPVRQHPRGRRARAGWAMALAVAAVALSPATSRASGLVAAYDRYETGKGFEIGLVNVSTGASIPLPAGVNTTDDELHPGLSRDGRYMVFARMRLLPKLNGDIVPPAQRTLHLLDRQTGAITLLATGSGAPAGPSFSDRAARAVAWGVRPEGSCCVTKFSLVGTDDTISGSTGFGLDYVPAPAGQVLDVAHAAMASRDTRTSISLSATYSDTITGALQSGIALLLSTRRPSPSGPSVTVKQTYGGPGAPASHPATRGDDGYVALDLTSGADTDIQSLSFPDELTPTPAPEPISSSAPERMPAWSPDGLKLGFVRTTAGRRTLAIFDATPGLQTIVNPPLDLGADAPSPQTRAFQSSWGGLSLAESSALDVPVVSCNTSCIASLHAPLAAIPLRPAVSQTAKGQRIGIFVARVTGHRRLLGRRTPRIAVVGRVPLGATRKGTNRFRWNGKVGGRRLKAGTYLLTYRALERGRVLSTSGSVRFTVTARGTIRGVRRQR